MEYTKESLQNTWGVVESKEHAEFIIELAKSAGLDIGTCSKKSVSYFYTDDYYIGFTDSEIIASNRNKKQITIPPPPNAKPNFSDLPKRFDCICNKCGEKCCTGFCDAWPKVGDEVLYRGKKVNVLLAADNSGYIVVSIDGGYINPHIDDVQKPKSKQDLLIEDLHQKLLANNCRDEYLLTCDIVQGKIEGLSYNP